MATDVEQFQTLLQTATDEADEAKAEKLLRKALALTNHHVGNVHRDRTWWRTERVRVAHRLAVIIERRDANEDALEMLRSVYADVVNCDDARLRMMVQHDFGRFLMARGILDVALDMLQGARQLAIDVHDARVLGAVTGNAVVVLGELVSGREVTVKVRDLAGRTLVERTTRCEADRITIDVRDLAAGTYVLECRYEGTTRSSALRIVR